MSPSHLYFFGASVAVTIGDTHTLGTFRSKPSFKKKMLKNALEFSSRVFFLCSNMIFGLFFL